MDYDAWERPAIFSLIQDLGDVPEADMRRTFNLGIGAVAIVRPEDVPTAVDCLEKADCAPVRIGHVEAEPDEPDA